VKAFDTAADVPLSRLDERRQLLGQLRSSGDPLAADGRCQNLNRFQERAFELVAGPDARQAFDVEQEPAVVRDRYGRHPLGQNLLMARRLIESGVRLVNVVGWTGLKPGEKFMSVETWDMHGNAGIGIF
jgi:hypothetical protein